MGEKCLTSELQITGRKEKKWVFVVVFEDEMFPVIVDSYSTFSTCVACYLGIFVPHLAWLAHRLVSSKKG